MKILLNKQLHEVSGGCTVTIGGYTIDVAEVDCDYAKAMAKCYNYDLSTSGLIGYQPGGYSQMNIYSSDAVRILVNKNLDFNQQYYPFQKAITAVLPASMIA